MGVHMNKKNYIKISSLIFLSTFEKTYTFRFFSSCVIKISFKTIFRPPHQTRSKDFNQIGENIGPFWFQFEL